MTEKWIVDDCGTLINMQTRDTFDYVSDVCGELNERDKRIGELEKENHVLNAKVNRLTDELANCYEKLGW